MKTGWLLVNQFISTKKFTEQYRAFIENAKTAGLSLSLKKAQDIYPLISQGEGENTPFPDFVLFWDKDVRLAYLLEEMGVFVLNSSRSIALCDDKSLTYGALFGKVPMPKTIFAPLTYPAVGYSDLSFVEEAGEILGYPMVIKECFGSFGAQVYLVNTPEEAKEKVREISPTPFLMQAFVKSSAGKDVRMQVVGNRVVASMLRKNEQGDFRANLTNGGVMEWFSPSKEAEELAVFICQTLGLDFGGVDFLFGENDELLLCEVNSNAHFTNLQAFTGVNVPLALMEHIAKRLEERK